MEIQALRIVISDQDLGAAVARAAGRVAQVKNLRARITPAGVEVSGAYQMMVNVTFTTLWELAAQGATVTARLAEVKVSGFGGGLVKAALLGALGAAVRQEDAVQLAGESLAVDLERLLARHGFQARLHLTGIRCEQGSLVIEAAAPTA